MSAGSSSTNPGTNPGTIDSMPAVNVTFTDDELATVRTAAARRGSSIRTFVHQVVTDAASEQNRRVEEIARDVALKSAELNRRLA